MNQLRREAGLAQLLRDSTRPSGHTPWQGQLWGWQLRLERLDAAAAQS